MTDIKPDLVVTDLPDPSPSSPLKALEWLGDTVEEVVGGLRARGIKGACRQPLSCPLHNYLAEFGWNVSVGPTTISDYDVTRNYRVRHWETPSVCRFFIGLFDCGKYPDLIAD